MPLFQQSVLKKYISDIDKAQLQSAWQLFQQHFFNADIQQNIRNSKEEEYQEGLLRRASSQRRKLVYQLYGLSGERDCDRGRNKK